MMTKVLNTYESLMDRRFRGSKEQLIQRIELNLKDVTLKTWTKTRLRLLKEQITHEEIHSI